MAAMHGIIGHGKQVVATRQAQRAKVVVQALPENRPVVVTSRQLIKNSRIHE